MKRNHYLIPYSHEHQHALALSLRLARAAASGEPETLAEAIDQALVFAAQSLAGHMQQEEAVLLPMLNSFGIVTHEEIARIAAEHLELRTLHHKLARHRDDAQLAATFAERLRAHVRWEERELFEAWQRRVDEMGIDLERDQPDAATARVVATRTVAEAGSSGLAMGELNSTCVTIDSGTELSGMADRDLAIICVSGAGTLVASSDQGDVHESLTTGTVVLLAAGTERTIAALDDHLSFVTVHRRRSALQLA